MICILSKYTEVQVMQNDFHQYLAYKQIAGAFHCQVSNIDYELHHEITSQFAKSVSSVVIKLQTRTGKSLQATGTVTEISMQLVLGNMYFLLKCKALEHEEKDLYS